MTPLNAQHGERLKREGQQLSLEYSGDWSDAVLTELRAWITQRLALGVRDMTVEEFRATAESTPRSCQGWGSLPRIACKAGLIAPMLTADGHKVYRNAAAPKTRAHPVAVYLMRAPS